MLSMEDAIKALLSSGNDAAIAIADTVGAKLGFEGGAQAAFVAAMNAKAADLGCANTLFRKIVGSTCSMRAIQHGRDVATMSAYAMKSQTFRDIVSRTRHDDYGRAGVAEAPLGLESTDELIGVCEVLYAA